MSLPLSKTVRDSSYLKTTTSKNVGPGSYNINKSFVGGYYNEIQASVPFFSK